MQVIEPKEPFNADTDFTNLYFEEYVTAYQSGDAVNPKGLGFKILQGDNSEKRPLGVAGKKEMTLTVPIRLNKGHRIVEYKASEKRPIKVVTYLQKLQGRDR